MLLLVALAVGLMVVDEHTSWLNPARAWLESMGHGLVRVVGVTGRIADWTQTHLVAPGAVVTENEQLQAEVLVLRGQLQQLAALSAENTQLRALLNAAPRPGQRLLLTELISVSANPTRHQIHIDRGTADGVFVGQAVLDAAGLMGQVIDVGERRATVLLISDERHALPVSVVGSEVRTIAEGTGDYRRLRLRHVPPTLDLAVKDRLVTSGAGSRFPPGYAVGQVTAITQQRGQAFLEVVVEPAARLDRSRQLLLVFPEPEATPPESLEAPAEPTAAQE